MDGAMREGLIESVRQSAETHQRGGKFVKVEPADALQLCDEVERLQVSLGLAEEREAWKDSAMQRALENLRTTVQLAEERETWKNSVAQSQSARVAELEKQLTWTQLRLHQWERGHYEEHLVDPMEICAHPRQRFDGRWMPCATRQCDQGYDSEHLNMAKLPKIAPEDFIRDADAHRFLAGASVTVSQFTRDPIRMKSPGAEPRTVSLWRSI